jgi:outer membrane protein assembly factor BamB
MRTTLSDRFSRLCLVVGLLFVAANQRPVVAAEATPAATAFDKELTGSGIFLPSERLRERQFDQARRLITAGRMADAATLLDEMLSAEDDFFLDGDRVEGPTSQSMKTRVNEVIRDLPLAGMDAYQLQFRTRAERALAAAIAADDHEAIVKVARRWFHTAAGQRAALLTAVTLLESGQPLASAAWLSRIEAKPNAVLPPAVTAAVRLMHAAAESTSAENSRHNKLVQAITDSPKTARLAAAPLPRGGHVSDQILATQLIKAIQGIPGARYREVADWPVARGHPDRNPLCEADRPLLVPRYRVPLTLHPEEEQLLGERRRFFREQALPILPAGTPLAVGDLVLVQSRAGLIAIDFETGKRVWMKGQLAPSAFVDDEDEEPPRGEGGAHPLDPIFRDAASATLASDGKHVFVLESPSRIGRQASRQRRGPTEQSAATNRLAAYDLSDGHLRWVLPRDTETPKQRWYLGSPLPLGNELYVLVEEQQQISLQALAADTGEQIWSQALAEVEGDHDIASRQGRRWAGLSPAFAEGVLICPTGAGGTIAVDLTNRTLLWAYRFPIPKPSDVQQFGNGMQVRMRFFAGRVPAGPLGVENSDQLASGGWLDSLPTIAENLVLLTPLDSEELHCLDLHTGEVRWRIPRGEMISLAGVVDNRAILLGQRGVTAVSLDDGQPCWPEQPAFGGQFGSNRACGRGLLTASRFYVPLDSPGVAAVDLTTGRVVATSPSRDERLPGNLVAYRDEIISQGLGSLDVFHQNAPLERAIETAMADNPNDPWAVGWRGELRLANGETLAGLEDIRNVFGAAGPQPAPALVSRGIRFALQNDFSVAASFWQEGMTGETSPTLAAAIRQLAVAGYFSEDDPASAWSVCRSVLSDKAATANSERLVPDREDADLFVAENLWFQRQLHRLLPDLGEPNSTIPATLLEQVSSDADAALAAASSANTLASRREALTQFILHFGSDPTAQDARNQLADTLRVLSEDMTGTPRQRLLLELELLTLERLAREQAAPLAVGSGLSSHQLAHSEIDLAWPVGRVEAQKTNELSANGDVLPATSQPVTLIHHEQSAFPQATLETTGDRLILRDRFGHPIGSSMAIPSKNNRSRQLFAGNSAPTGPFAYLIGRVLLIQHDASVTAYEICPRSRGESRLLWTMDHPFFGGARRPTPLINTGPDRAFRPLGPQALGSIDAPRQPHEITRVPDFRLGRPQVRGVPVIYKQTLELRDLRTGAILWRRQNIPPLAEVFGNGEVLCVTTPEGSDSLVLAMSDGRLLCQRELPSRSRRLAAAGRQLLIIAEATEETKNATTALPLATLDILTGQVISVGNCSKFARAVQAEWGVFMTIAPDGELMTFDIAASRVMFSTTLPEMIPNCVELSCLPWQDRYLVFVSRGETKRDDRRFAAIQRVEPFSTGNRQFATQSGSLWAIDRLTGDQLWNRPASIERHVLHRPQPPGLPVLVFARRMFLNRSGSQAGQLRHSLLCLDKRTGAEVHCDDKILFEERHAGRLTSLDIIGDPNLSTVSLRMQTVNQIGGKIPEIVLFFTGEPDAEAIPYRTEDHPLIYTDFSSELQYWIESGIEGIGNALELWP